MPSSNRSVLQALQAAEMISAPLLRQAALFHAEHNLFQVAQQKGFQEVVSGSPGLAEVRAITLCRIPGAMARSKKALQARDQESPPGRPTLSLTKRNLG